jgi:predicted permease
MRKLLRRLFYWTHQQQLEADTAEELEFHRAMRQEQLRQADLPPDEAAAESYRALGNTSLAREEARGIWIWPWLERILQDTRFALRLISKNLFFVITSIVLMASTIGLSSAAFAVLDATVLRKLPAPHPEQLVVLVGISERGRVTLTPSAFDLLQRERRYIAQMFGFTGTVIQGTVDGAPRILAAFGVRGNYFAALGAIPQLGRFMGPDEREPAVVISDDMWHRDFAAAPDIIGRSLTLGKTEIPIIGVARSDFRGVEPHVNWDIVLPLNVFEQVVGIAIPGGFPLEIAARLKTGATAREYEAQLNTLWPTLLQSTIPAKMTMDAWRSQIGAQVRVDSLSHGLNYIFIVQPGIPRAIKMTFWLSVLIFCAGCLTLALLAVAHIVKNQHQAAIMLAMGGRWRVLRPYFIEMAIISGLGCAAGLLFAVWLSALGESFLPSTGTVKWRVKIDSNPIMLGFMMAFLMALLGGIIASLLAFRTQVSRALHVGTTVSHPYVRLRMALLASQLAISVVLVHYALLYAGDLSHLSHMPIGFDTQNLHVYSLGGKLPAREVDNNYLKNLMEQIRQLPGVESASMTVTGPPLSYLRANMRPVITDDGRTAQATGVCVFPGFFNTLHLPMLSGRDFSWRDRASAIVTSRLAKELYSGGNPLTNAIKIGQLRDRLEIVGVVGNVAYNGPRIGALPIVFIPCAETVNPFPSGGAVHILVRSKRTLADLEKDVAAQVERLGIHFVMGMTDEEEYLSRSLRQERMLAAVSSMFGGSIVLLAGAGLYACCNYLLALRTKELAIRASLGAGPAQIAAALLRETAKALAFGSVIGIAMTFAGQRVLSSMMESVNPPSAGHITAALLIIAGVTLGAVLVPTVRALRMSVVDALRVE